MHFYRKIKIHTVIRSFIKLRRNFIISLNTKITTLNYQHTHDVNTVWHSCEEPSEEDED